MIRTLFILLIGLVLYCSSYWWWPPETSTCQCKHTNAMSVDSPYDRLVCREVKTTEAVTCLDGFLKNLVHQDKILDLQVEISYSDPDKFGDHIFDRGAILTSLRLTSCGLDEIPSRFISREARHLKSFRIDNNAIHRLPAKVLVKCTNLQILDLSANKINWVSSKAFAGLANLIELHLQYNVIESLEAWDGLENLRLLNLAGNNIRKVSSNAFLAMTKLTTLNLGENQIKTLKEETFHPIMPQTLILAFNPFNCTCSLKWLQNWILANDAGSDAFCANPETGLLKTLDFCSPTIPKQPEQWPTWLSARLQVGIALGITLILYAVFK